MNKSDRQVFRFFQRPIQDVPETHMECRIYDSQNRYLLVIEEEGFRQSLLEVPKEGLKTLKQMLYEIQWNREYWGEIRIMDGDDWGIEADFPEVCFRSYGYQAYPSDYEYVRGRLLDEIHWLFRKYGPLSGFDVDVRNLVSGCPPTVVRAKEYTAYRTGEMGSGQYTFFYGWDLLGKAETSLDSSFPVTMTGCGMELYSESGITIVPGNSRLVTNKETGELYAKIIYTGRGNHTLLTKTEQIKAETKGDTCWFYRYDRKIAKLQSPRLGEKRFWPQKAGKELAYFMTVTEKLPDELALLLMAFPFLRIAP